MFFPVGGQQQQRTFQLIQMDTSLIGAALNAKVLSQTASTSNLGAGTFAAQEKLLGLGPIDVIPPWKTQEGLLASERSLNSRIGEVRKLSKFINERDPDVRLAGESKDAKTLFTLYKALDALKTIAEYGSQKTTPESSLARLNTQFLGGIQEVINYLPTAETEKLSLVLNEKNDDIKTTARLGDNSYTYLGDVSQKGSADDPMAGVSASDTFTVRLTKNLSGDFDDVLIDMSKITGDISINKLVDLINQEIDAVTVDDGSGTQVPKYVTNFSVGRDDNNDYFIQIDGSSTEQVNFSATTSDPSLVISSTRSTFNEDDPETGLLTRFNDVESVDPTRSTTDEVLVRSVDDDSSRIKEAAAGSEEEETSALAKFESLTGTTVVEDDEEDTTTEEETFNSKDTSNTSDGFDDPVLAKTTPNAVVVDSQGYSYIVGTAEGSMGSQLNDSTSGDVFLTKVDSNGNVMFSRLLGADSSAEGFDIALDSNDNVIVTGKTTSDLSGTDNIKGTTDAFVAKFDSQGTEKFRYQLDSFSATSGVSVAIDVNDDIIIGGSASGSISSTSGYGGGSSDNLLLKVDGSTGTLVNSTVFGGAGSEAIRDIAFASDGDLMMTTYEDGIGYLKKIDATDLSTEVYSHSLGAMNADGLAGLAVDGSKVYIAGTTDNASYTGGAASVTNAHGGGQDGYVTGFTDNGASLTADFTTFIGGDSTDKIADVVATNGNVYVAGETRSAIGTNERQGNIDAFAAKIDGTTGTLGYVEQYGQAFGETKATSLAFTDKGSSVLGALGLPSGDVHQDQVRDIVNQTSVNDGDFFYVSVDGGAKRKITINEGDTYSTLARKLNTLSFRGIEAEVLSKTSNPQLQIKAKNGSEIEFFAGKEGQDALAGLGLEPTRLISSEKLFTSNKMADGKLDENDLGGLFALGIDPGFNLGDKTTAKYVFNKLGDAMGTIERAFRSLTFSVVDLQLSQKSNNFGPPPAYLAQRTAEFQDALLRVQSLNFSSNSGFIV